MLAVGSDDVYSLEEIAIAADLNAGSMYRWRQAGRLVTTYDLEICPATMKRVGALLRQDPSNARKPLPPGTLPVTRFFLEDAVRMLVISRLGAAGFDRVRLFEALAWPYAVFIERGRAPHYLAIWPDGVKLDREAFNTERELQQVLATKPLAVVIDLDCYRQQMRKSLARIIEIRDEKTARFEARARALGRFVKEKV